MARVKAFDHIPKDATRVHGEVECGYSVFENGGHRFIQLDTYGSAGRKRPGKTSQTIQLDEDAAQALILLLRRTFPEN